VTRAVLCVAAVSLFAPRAATSVSR